MPAALEKCVLKVKAQGHPESNAYAICRSAMGLAQDGSRDEEAAETVPDDETIEKGIQALGLAAIPKRRDVSPESGPRDYGNVPFADPTNKKYPIDTEEHIRAAWNYIHKAHNAAQYDAAAVAKIKSRIVSAWKRVIDKAGPPSAMQAMDAPTIVKRIPICVAVGKYVNGPQKGAITRARLQGLVDNFKKYPRQVPIYLLTGKPDPEHPEDLDSRWADGWVEALSMEGDTLMALANLHGDAATAVESDAVRGSSIGTDLSASDYDGTPIGEILEHVVLTNQPFVKNMNIAAALARGGEKVACYFTALKEAPVADPKKKPDPAAGADDGSVNFKEKSEALKTIVDQQLETIEELTASRDNLLKEVETYRENPQLQEAVTQMRQMKRQLLSEKIRRLVNRMCENGQVVRDTVKWAFGDSDETVLAGFENGPFKGNIELLEFALQTYPKQRFRTYTTGMPIDGDATSAFTPEQATAIKSEGKDPEVVAALQAKKVTSYTDYLRAKAARKAS